MGARFQVLFHSPRGVLFTFPSRYLCAIGLMGVFSLAGWARLFHAGFLVSRATQDSASRRRRFAYGALTLSGAAFQPLPLASTPKIPRSYYPRHGSSRNRTGLGYSPFARHY